MKLSRKEIEKYQRILNFEKSKWPDTPLFIKEFQVLLDDLSQPQPTLDSDVEGMIDTLWGTGTRNNPSKIVDICNETRIKLRATFSDMGKELHLKQDAIDTLIKSYAKVNSKLSQYESVVEVLLIDYSYVNDKSYNVSIFKQIAKLKAIKLDG